MRAFSSQTTRGEDSRARLVAIAERCARVQDLGRPGALWFGGTLVDKLPPHDAEMLRRRRADDLAEADEDGVTQRRGAWALHPVEELAGELGLLVVEEPPEQLRDFAGDPHFSAAFVHGLVDGLTSRLREI